MKKLLLTVATLATCAQLMAQNTGIGTTNPTDQLHTTGSVRFQNYSGNGTRLMYVDSAGRLTPPPAPQTFSNNVKDTILDNQCAANVGASRSITVTGLPSLAYSANITVRVNITHAYIGDLNIYLIAPNGSVLCLANVNEFPYGDLSNAVFSDAGLVVNSGIQPPQSGIYKPAGAISGCLITANAASFSAIGGGYIVPNGTWTLKVFDGVSQDAGTLNSWSIGFSGINSFGTSGANNAVPYFSNGNLAISNITASQSGFVGINTNSPNANLDVNGSLNASGATTLNGLNVSGASTFNAQTTSGTTTLNGSLVANSLATFGGNVNLNGALVANNLATFGGNVNLNGTTTIASSQTTGAAVMNGTVTIASGSPAVNKVLTANTAGGAAVWSFPAPYNTGYKVFSSGTVSVSAGATGTVLFDATASGSGRFDDGNNFSNTTHAYVAPAAGVYQFSCTVAITAGTAASAGVIQLIPTGSGVSGSNLPVIEAALASGAAFPRNLNVSFLTRLSAGETMIIRIFQNVAGSVAVGGGGSSFTGVRLY